MPRETRAAARRGALRRADDRAAQRGRRGRLGDGRHGRRAPLHVEARFDTPRSVAAHLRSEVDPRLRNGAETTARA